MNRPLTLILTLSSLAAFAQDSSSTRHKLFIGVSFSSDYCYRTLTKNSNNISDSAWNFSKNYEDSVENAKFGYTAGINFCYFFNEKFSVETGVFYSNKGYRTIPLLSFISANPVIEFKTVSFIYHYTYLDFPFTANYTFLNKRVQLVAGIGATLNVFLNATFTAEPKEAIETVVVISDDYKGNRINISPTVKIGMQYQINEKMNLRVEPNYRYGIFGLDDKSYKTVHLWSAGVNIGYYYKIK